MPIRLPTPPRLYTPEHQAQHARAIQTYVDQNDAAVNTLTKSIAALSAPVVITGIPADLTALFAALGVAPTGWWSTRAGVTAGATNITAWQDVRGSGFGGQWLAAGVGPAWSPGAKTITGAGAATDYMALASSALFDLSTGGTWVWVGSITTGVNDSVCVSISESSLTRILAISGNATGQLGTVCRGSATLLDSLGSTATNSATRRLAVGARNATTTAQIQVPNKTLVTGTTDAAAAGNLGAGLWDYFKTTSVGQGGFGAGVLVELGWFKGVVLTPTQTTALNTWALASPISITDA